ncbi:hypothetical protein WR25_15175 [Diploscapter pachys]|uniref:Uncharacterized protein n=1 Tax=Diploscapter pachys TaxID=2018661 RepID=A0A2A2KP31_9BILA|nr:hypothetical protein WR25_15175 [Diploscapter pachys]
MEPIDPNEWLRAVVIDECNDLQFLVTSNGKVLLSKRRWTHKDMDPPKVGDSLLIRVTGKPGRFGHLIDYYVQEFKNIEPFTNYRVVERRRKPTPVVQFFTKTYEKIGREEIDKQMVDVYRTCFFDKVYDTLNQVRSPNGVLRIGAVRVERSAGIIGVFEYYDDLDIGDMSQKFSNSLMVTGKDEATSSYAESLPSNDTVVETERTEENKKRTEATEVCGVIVQSTDGKQLCVCHVDNESLQPYFLPFPQNLWHELEQDLQCKITKKEQLIGKWVSFVFDEWELLDESKPIRHYTGCSVKLRVTKDNNVELLDTISYDGRSHLGDRAVCSSNVGNALDYHRFIDIDGSKIKELPCWLRCEKYNKDIGWMIEEMVDEKTEKRRENGQSSRENQRSNGDDRREDRRNDTRRNELYWHPEEYENIVNHARRLMRSPDVADAMRNISEEQFDRLRRMIG